MSLKDQNITDITNGCNYIDELVAAKYQLGLDEVKNSGEDLSAFNTSVSNAEAYIATL